MGTLDQTAAGFWLSPQQQFIWKIEQEVLRASSRAACLISLQGDLDFERLYQSLKDLAARHETLRTVFVRQAGMKVPFQAVLDKAQVDWQQKDLSANPQFERKTQVEKLFAAERNRELQPESEPVLSAVLIMLGEKSFALILSLPSMCADGRSLQILGRELGVAYSGAGSTLPEPFRYVQFAQWQTDLLSSDEDDARNGRDFWSKQQAESGPPPALPGEGKCENSALQPELIVVNARQHLSSKLAEHPEPASFLFSAWVSLLLRLSGQSAIRVGLVADNRQYEELENAVGCFARTLSLSARVGTDFRFSDLLRQAQKNSHEAIAAQEYFAPEGIGTDGDLVSFSYHDLGKEETRDGIRFKLERLQVVSEPFKLRLAVLRRGGELDLEFHYDAARLERGAVERIAGYYQNLLAAALENPATAIAKLPLLSESERHQLVVEWNQTTASYPEKQCLHEWFEQQAAKTPERLGLRSGEQTLTYRELNERANQLAHYLRSQGVGPDRPVGLCVERSAEMMVAVLAILKAGGAYVPLNPDNPAARLQQQLAGAAAVITESKLVGNLPEFGGQECPPHTIVLDRDPAKWANEPKTNPASNTHPDNLVYIIYTSGSTGVPKGVAVRHRNLVNYADFISKRLALEKYPEGLQFATVSTLGADLGNTCIYPSLISGGCLHIVGYEMATDPQNLSEYLTKHPVDVLKIVPSHLQALVQSEQARKLLPWKYLILGGETLTPKLLEKIESLAPTCEILNHYGPTETTVGSLTLKLKDYDWKQAKLASIPIGRPIQNTQVYILDQNLEPVPIGVTGELYIAGAGVTAGYLGQAEKTAERFLKNPFVDDPTAKMYRTGDLARYAEDGTIEFLGRGDDQVKVRGFRIELGEIEAVLAQHAGVKQVVVLAREDAQGDKRLLAYVVPSRESSANAVTGETLRAYVKQQLPDYMVPQAIMLLGKIPLTANGKIDRQALPEPEQAAEKKTYLAPRTPTEQTIAEIWAEVLRRDKTKISIDDNFFDLGGHSLLATQVVSRLRQQFSVEISMRVMFDQPRIDGLAEAVQEAQKVSVEAEDLVIAPVSREAYRG